MDGPLARLLGGGSITNNPFQTKKFKEELSTWNKRLEKKGFEDIEKRGSKYRTREAEHSMSNLQRDKILTFFLHLDWLLTFYDGMPKFERRVMKMYSAGVFVKKIVKECKSSDRNVRNVIKRYKHLVLAIIRMTTNADNPFPLRLISPTAVSKVTADAEDRFKNKAA